ncbi:hypothetical protein BDV06DRAFT_190668 [Aspergillus oleicola]
MRLATSQLLPIDLRLPYDLYGTLNKDLIGLNLTDIRLNMPKQHDGHDPPSGQSSPNGLMGMMDKTIRGRLLPLYLVLFFMSYFRSKPT